MDPPRFRPITPAMNTRFVAVAATILTLAGLAAQAAPAAGFDPGDFDVQIDMGMNGPNGAPSCRDDGSGGQVCTTSQEASASGRASKGTVRNTSRNLSGSIETACDLSMRMRVEVRIPRSGSAAKVTEFGGGGDMRCSWSMDFGGGTTLTGTIAGEMKQGLASATTGYSQAHFSVTVVAGAGEFAGYVGSGTWDERDEFPLMHDAPSGPQAGSGPPPGAAPASPPPSTAPSGATRSLASVFAAAREGGAMKLKLRKGRPIAKIVAPAPKLSRTDTRTVLRVVTAPGATCTASARSGAAKVALGKAVDTDRNGAVAFTGKLASLLKPGAWKLSASCTYALGARKGAAADSSSVSVA